MNAERDPSWMPVVISKVSRPCRDILFVELAPASGRLPSFGAGAHIAVQVGGHIRHYSLFGSMRSPTCFRIAVKREAHSRGGSQWFFEHAKPGATLRASRPRNNFPLTLGGASYLLIAGGIGITPILPMLVALQEAGIRVRFVYLARSPEVCGFGEYIAHAGKYHDVHVHYDTVVGTTYDILSELERHGGTTHVYCCGPLALMNAVRSFAEQAGEPTRFHFEYFAPPPEAPVRSSEASSFYVVAARSGKTVEVGEGQSILAALSKVGIDIESECEEGVCGTCIVPVLEGEPEHRDFVLTCAERDAGSRMAVCISRSKTQRLVLDV